MTSSIVARMSKKRRMPDGGTLRTRSLRARSARGGRDASVVMCATAYGIGFQPRTGRGSVSSGENRLGKLRLVAVAGQRLRRKDRRKRLLHRQLLRPRADPGHLALDHHEDAEPEQR